MCVCVGWRKLERFDGCARVFVLTVVLVREGKNFGGGKETEVSRVEGKQEYFEVWGD